MDVRQKLIKLLDKIIDGGFKQSGYLYESMEQLSTSQIADHLIANGVTVQEQNEEGCPYCDIAKANDGVINTKLWVKEPETNRWTMEGKRLNFCPMCGRRLPEPPKEVE